MKRGRLWLNNGSCVRLRLTHYNHVWSYDFMADCTHDGRPIIMITVIDEYSRECLAIVAERNLKSDDVWDCQTEMFIVHGAPEHIRSDNGSEFTVKVVRQWLSQIGVQTFLLNQAALKYFTLKYKASNQSSFPLFCDAMNIFLPFGKSSHANKIDFLFGLSTIL